MRFDTLQRRMALLFVAALVVVQVVVFVVVDWATTTIARENLRSELDTDVRVFQRINDIRTQQLADVVRVLSADFGFRQAAASQDHNTVLSALVNQSTRIGADIIMMLSPDGRVFASTAGPPGQAFPYPGMIGLAETRNMAHDIVFIGTRAYRLTLIPVLAPLPIGYLAVGMGVDDRWAARLTQEGQFNISFLALDNHQWQMIGSSRPAEFASVLPLRLRGTLPDSTRHFGMTVGGGDWENVFIPLSGDQGGRPVAALLQRSLDEGLKPFQFPRLVLLGVMIASIVLFAIGAILLARSLTRPLNHLTRSVSHIARGDYSQRAYSEGVREVADLGSAFNRMAESLAASTVSRAYVDNILQSMGEAVIVTGADGRIDTVNRAALALTGYTGPELAGRPVGSLFADSTLTLERQMALTASGFAGAASSQSIVRRDGRLIPVEVAQSALEPPARALLASEPPVAELLATELQAAGTLPASLEQARPAGTIYLLTDVSQIKRAALDLHAAKEAAEAANRSKSEFLANMSHEIRTPMNAVIGFANLAAETADSKQRADYLHNIRTAGESLLTVINDILDFSKVEAGKLALDWDEADMRALAADVAALMRPQVHARGLALKLDFSPGLPNQFVCDPMRVRQILLNLVSNAMKFTHEGGIEVRVEPAGEAGAGALAFSVIDSGIGIPLDKQAHIFDPFAQADASTTRRYGGTGLGLSISSRLVALMGGSIAVDSAPGRGSTFRFVLPRRTLPDDSARRLATARAAAAAAAAAAEAGANANAAGNANTVRPQHLQNLIVADDNDMNRTLVIAMLRQLPYTVHHAVNGLEAIGLWQRYPDSIILMDVQMPELDGLEATRRIRALEAAHGAHVPIIALTANARLEDEQECLAAGMDAFISKPVKKALLLETIGRYGASPSPSPTVG